MFYLLNCLQKALWSKSHLRGFVQVLRQHYEVDQRLRVTAVLQAEDRGRQRVIVNEINKNATVCQRSLRVSRGGQIVNECCMCETKQLWLESHVATSAISSSPVHFHPEHLCHQGRTFTTPSFQMKLLVWADTGDQQLVPTDSGGRQREAVDNQQLNEPLSRLKYWHFLSLSRSHGQDLVSSQSLKGFLLNFHCTLIRDCALSWIT